MITGHLVEGGRVMEVQLYLTNHVMLINQWELNTINWSWYNSPCIWRRLPPRLSKHQSLSTTVLFRTTPEEHIIPPSYEMSPGVKPFTAIHFLSSVYFWGINFIYKTKAINLLLGGNNFCKWRQRRWWPDLISHEESWKKWSYYCKGEHLNFNIILFEWIKLLEKLLMWVAHTFHWRLWQG